MKVEFLFRRPVTRRPVIVRSPFIRSGLVDQRFGQLPLTFVFEVITEKRKLYLLAEVDRRLVGEANVAQRIPVPIVVPSAVAKWPDDQNALVRRRLFYLLIDGERAVEVFGIEPARDVQDGQGNVLEVSQKVLLLPVIVVVGMLHVAVPLRHLIEKVFLVD